MTCSNCSADIKSDAPNHRCPTCNLFVIGAELARMDIDIALGFAKQSVDQRLEHFNSMMELAASKPVREAAELEFNEKKIKELEAMGRHDMADRLRALYEMK